MSDTSNSSELESPSRVSEIKGKLQAAADLHTLLKHEFIKRDLSTDNLPKGYRKLTNEELITKVVAEYSSRLFKELEGIKQ